MNFLYFLLILILFSFSCKKENTQVSPTKIGEKYESDNPTIKLDLSINSLDQYTAKSLVIVTSSWNVGTQVNKKVIENNIDFLKKAGIKIVEIDGSKMYPELKSFLTEFNSIDLPLTILFMNGKPHKLPSNYDATTFINFINKVNR